MVRMACYRPDVARLPVVQLKFVDAVLARACSSRRLLQQRWGRDCGLAVGRGLLMLRAAPDLDAVRTIPACRELPEIKGWRIDVLEAARIDFSAADRRTSIHDQSSSLEAEDSLLLIREIVTAKSEGA